MGNANCASSKGHKEKDQNYVTAETRQTSDVSLFSRDPKPDPKYQLRTVKNKTYLPTELVQHEQKNNAKLNKDNEPNQFEGESSDVYIHGKMQKNEHEKPSRNENRITYENHEKDTNTVQKENDDECKALINAEYIKQQESLRKELNNMRLKYEKLELLSENLRIEKDVFEKDNEAMRQKLKEHDTCIFNIEKTKEEIDILVKENETLKKRNEDVERDINGYKDEILKLRHCLDSHIKDKETSDRLTKEIETHKMEKEVFQNQITNIRSEHSKLLENLESDKLALKNKHKAIQQEKVEENVKLLKLVDDLENRLKNVIDENEKSDLQILKFKECDENRRKTIEQIRQKVQKLEDENKNLMENSLRTTERQIHEKEEFEQTIADINEKRSLLEIENKSLLQENLSLESKLKTQEECNDATLNELKNEFDQLRERNSKNEKVVENFRFENETLQQKFDSLQKELDELKNSKVMRIQLYHPQRAALVSEVESELKALLKKEMDNEMTELEFTECDGACHVDPNVPVIIVCVSASRLGTDAQNAIQLLKVTSKMALVIFHHKDTHALPTQASGRVLTGQVFKRLGGIYDIAFLSVKGIYQCEMNEQNLKNIVHFLNKESVRCIGERT